MHHGGQFNDLTQNTVFHAFDAIFSCLEQFYHSIIYNVGAILIGLVLTMHSIVQILGYYYILQWEGCEIL